MMTYQDDTLAAHEKVNARHRELGARDHEHAMNDDTYRELYEAFAALRKRDEEGGA